MLAVEKLPEDKRHELNLLARWEFGKPPKYRFKAKQLLNLILGYEEKENKKTIFNNLTSTGVFG